MFFHTSFGQTADRKSELDKYFLNLPLDTNLTELILAAKSDTEIKKDTEFAGGFYGILTHHLMFDNQPGKYRLAIYKPNKAAGFDIPDSNNVRIALSAKYNVTHANKIRKQFRQIVRTFKKVSAKSVRFSEWTNYRKIRDGFDFFRTSTEKNPYLTIYFDNGQRLKDNYSIRIIYIRLDIKD